MIEFQAPDGPALMYVHADGQTISQVDVCPLDDLSARDRAFLDALLTYCQRRLDHEDALPFEVRLQRKADE